VLPFIDAGALLHRYRWQKGVLFQCISSAYVRYVQTGYGYERSSNVSERSQTSLEIFRTIELVREDYGCLIAYMAPYTQPKKVFHFERKQD
jgi:hypothetical protein